MGIVALLFGLTQASDVFADIKNMTVIDVRTTEEFLESHVNNSLNIDILRSDFRTIIEKLDRNKSYKLYCRSGNRSGQAEKLMKSLGFKDVENLGSLKQAAKRLNLPCEGKSC